MLSVKKHHPPAKYDPLIAYGDWRDACVAVSTAYRDWADASKADAARTYSVYATALDREDAAADAYSRAIQEGTESAGTRSGRDLGTARRSESW